jgi:hypothetical protein
MARVPVVGEAQESLPVVGIPAHAVGVRAEGIAMHFNPIENKPGSRDWYNSNCQLIKDSPTVSIAEGFYKQIVNSGYPQKFVEFALALLKSRADYPKARPGNR